MNSLRVHSAILRRAPTALSIPATSGASFGVPVASAGDVNGDGYADVAVGTSGNVSYTGEASVAHGLDERDKLGGVAFPVSEHLLRAAEQELGVSLLPAHRARLARNNGGEVECVDDVWQLHPVWDDTDRKRAARTASHIAHETREARRWKNFPSDGIAIAGNGTGDRLLFRRDAGVVEFWDHETGECSPVDVDWA